MNSMSKDHQSQQIPTLLKNDKDQYFSRQWVAHLKDRSTMIIFYKYVWYWMYSLIFLYVLKRNKLSGFWVVLSSIMNNIFVLQKIYSITYIISIIQTISLLNTFVLCFLYGTRYGHHNYFWYYRRCIIDPFILRPKVSTK